MEEKLQKLLDDLRLGKYDSDNYELECFSNKLYLTDISKNVELCLCFYRAQHTEKINIWKTNYYLEYIVDVSDIGEIKISKDLYESFMIFLKEQIEKEALLKRLNIKSAFDL